jgi:hypothetical protein
MRGLLLLYCRWTRKEQNSVRISLAHLALAAVLIGIAAGLGTVAQACTLDKHPSMSADGTLPRITLQVPTTRTQYATWSYFFFPLPFRAGQSVTLSENRQEVARTLVASALQHPWGWAFGDGSVAMGWTVRHA